MTEYPSLRLAVLMAALLWLSCWTGPAIAQSCSDGGACVLGERSYHGLPPDNWDGVTPLPVLLHFHGWGRQGTVPLNHQHIGAATRTNGVLLVAPNGLGKSWAFWQPGSRDTEFTRAVIRDVGERFPLDGSQIMVSGYSWGASMAWRFACEAGNRVSILLSISGTLYDQDENCETGPVEIRHVHGLKDTVMDYPYGPDADEAGAVRLWTRINGCDGPEKSSWSTSQKFTRYTWTDCKSGKNVRLDVHGGGHWIAKGWLEEQFQQLKAEFQK